MMGNGSTLMLSMEAGSGLPSEKSGVDYESGKLTAESILDLGRGGGKASPQLGQVKSGGGGNEESKAKQLHGIVGVAFRIQRTLDTVNL